MRAPWQIHPKTLWEAAAHGPAIPLGTIAAYASLATTVAGAGLSVVGQLRQQQSQRQMALYQQKVAQNNVILAQRAADDATARGKVEADIQRQKTRQLIGKQRSVMAENGVLVDTGSAADITADTAAIGELDRLNILNNAQRERQYYLAQGMNFQGEAGLHRMAARNSSGFPWGTLIGGLGSVAEKWYTLDQQGALKWP